MNSWPLLLLLAILAAPGPAAAAEPTAAATPTATPAEERDPMSPPPGSPEDRALWQTMIDTQNAVVATRDQAARQLQRLNVVRYDLRLDALAKGAPAERAAQIGKVKQRFLEAWHDDYRVLSTPWPIHWHTGCRYQRLNLEAAMEGSIPQLEAVRSEARECLAKQAPALKAMQEANKNLQAALAEVDALLATSPQGEQAAPPAPAAAAGAPARAEPEAPAAPKPAGK
jgi:hypothetical protein